MSVFHKLKCIGVILEQYLYNLYYLIIENAWLIASVWVGVLIALTSFLFRVKLSRFVMRLKTIKSHGFKSQSISKEEIVNAQKKGSLDEEVVAFDGMMDAKDISDVNDLKNLVNDFELNKNLSEEENKRRSVPIHVAIAFAKEFGQNLAVNEDGEIKVSHAQSIYEDNAKYFASINAADEEKLGLSKQVDDDIVRGDVDRTFDEATGIETLKGPDFTIDLRDGVPIRSTGLMPETEPEKKSSKNEQLLDDFMTMQMKQNSLQKELLNAVKNNQTNSAPKSDEKIEISSEKKLQIPAKKSKKIEKNTQNISKNSSNNLKKVENISDEQRLNLEKSDSIISDSSLLSSEIIITPVANNSFETVEIGENTSDDFIGINSEVLRDDVEVYDEDSIQNESEMINNHDDKPIELSFIKQDENSNSSNKHIQNIVTLTESSAKSSELLVEESQEINESNDSVVMEIEQDFVSNNSNEIVNPDTNIKTNTSMPVNNDGIEIAEYSTNIEENKAPKQNRMSQNSGKNIPGQADNQFDIVRKIDEQTLNSDDEVKQLEVAILENDEVEKENIYSFSSENLVNELKQHFTIEVYLEKIFELDESWNSMMLLKTDSLFLFEISMLIRVMPSMNITLKYFYDDEKESHRYENIGVLLTFINEAFNAKFGVVLFNIIDSLKPLVRYLLISKVHEHKTITGNFIVSSKEISAEILEIYTKRYFDSVGDFLVSIRKRGSDVSPYIRKLRINPYIYEYTNTYQTASNFE
jgi:hypothetical protein